LTSERRTAGAGAVESFVPAATGMPPARLVRWSTWEMALAIGLAAGAWFAAPLLTRTMALDRAGKWFLFSLMLDAAFAGVPLALLLFRHRRPLLSTLLPESTAAKDFGWGLSLALIVGALNALAVKRAVAGDAQGLSAHPAYYLEAYKIDGMRKLVLFVFGWGVFPPIAEEIFFRGFLFAALRRRMRAPFAVMLSAAAFALIHPFGEPMLAAFVLGLVVATVYEYSGSLLPPIMAHMGLNLSFVLFMAFKGELASAVPRWVFIATAAVFVGHFFLSSRYLFRRAR
jgi:membrane protease YdiL (CAAX protease family)